jgi:peptide deformylase
MEIMMFGQEVLTRKAKEVTDFTVVPDLVKGMFEVLEKGGIGLAAPQVGVSLRLFITSIEGKKKVFINPKITSTSDMDCVIEEGCLSFPGVILPIRRPQGVMLEYYDEDNKKQGMWATDILARVIQHEYDHLDGILFIKYYDWKEERK